MPTRIMRLWRAVAEELRSPVAPFPADHARTYLVALFLYLSNAALLAYEWGYHSAHPWTMWLTGLCLVLTTLMALSKVVTERIPISYAAWIRPIFFAHLAVLASLRYIADPSPMNECLMLAGALLYFIHGVDLRICAGDVIIGSGIAYAISLAFGISADGAALFFLILICAIAGLLFMAKEIQLRRDRMKTIRTLIGVMAHELRTPLATISLSAELMDPLLDAGTDPERGAALLKRLRGSVRYMHAIIDNQIANSGTASREGETQLFDLSELVRLVHEDFPYRLDSERDCVVLNLKPKAMVRCSETIMRQVITNLHKNAITAVAKTGRTFAKGDLELWVTSSPTAVTLVVTDKGVGIAPKDQGRIFDPFYSATPKAAHGLGLTQVREAVHFMGGLLSFESVLGEGTAFKARFPVEIV